MIKQIMEKIKYIAPEVQVLEMDVIDMLAASISLGEEGKDAGDSFSNRHRGTWGDLWGDDEKK